MKILILGSGVIGTSCAYYLTRAGHQVVVVDRQGGPALETSFANAGEVSPGYSAPWAGPGVPLKAIHWMLMQHSPLVIWPMLDPMMWRWGLSTLRNCTEARYALNKGRMVRLAEYSRDCLRQLRADTGIRYDERSQGTLQLFRTQKQLDGTGKDIEILRQYGVAFELLDRAGYIVVEPALAHVQEKFVGALRLPGDETGDCFMFTQNLAGLAREAGAEFRYGVQIKSILSDSARITGVVTDQGVLTANAYLVALGSYSPLALRPIGIRIPVYPVKGYSITVPIDDATCAPESTIMDETHKVAVTRLGDRIRVGGHCGAGRLQPGLARESPRNPEPRFDRSVSARSRRGQRHPLGRPAANDTRWNAGDWRLAVSQSLPGHGTRYLGLDDGGRHRPRHGGSDVRPAHRDQPGWLDHRSVPRSDHQGALARRRPSVRPRPGKHCQRGAPRPDAEPAKRASPGGFYGSAAKD